jgi:hypothetical protein
MTARRRPEWMSALQWKMHWQRCARARKAGLPEPAVDEPFHTHGGDRQKRVYLKPGARAPIPPEVQALVDLTRRPITFEDLCDRLNKAPGQVRKLVQEAHALGISLQLGAKHLQLTPQEQLRSVQDTLIQPTSGSRQQVGVISDLHLGSKYCLRAQLQDCVQHFYAAGIRAILVGGDLLDGCYGHGVFELSHTGLEDQTRDLYETLPALPGLHYLAITGNHDLTFHATSGVNVGRFIQGFFNDHGRQDLRFFGDCGAFLRLQGAIIELWHPLGGLAYAKSYKLQKHIEGYSAGQKPHICLAAHWHAFAVVEARGVFAVALPCFQAGGSAFSKRLGGDPALGGLLLSWEIAGADLVRNFAVERRRYFEVEPPFRVDDPEQVPA